MTQREARKFGRQFNPWQLYKFVSGVNAVRLRKLLSTVEGEDYPADPKQAYRHLRQATLTGSLEIPDVNLERDIGGYDKTKRAACVRKSSTCCNAATRPLSRRRCRGSKN